MRKRIDQLNKRRQLRILGLVVPLLLGGCGWPMDPVPTHELTYQGRVTRSATGAPIAAARVEVWLAPADVAAGTAPFVEGETNASGEFRVARKERASGVPPDVTIRVTPPAGSGVSGRTVSGFVRDVFSSIARNGDRVTYSVSVALEPATAP